MLTIIKCFRYEAWVIYNFLSLCLAWVGGPGAVVSSLSGQSLKPSCCLMTCCFPAIPLDGSVLSVRHICNVHFSELIICLKNTILKFSFSDTLKITRALWPWKFNLLISVVLHPQTNFVLRQAFYKKMQARLFAVRHFEANFSCNYIHPLCKRKIWRWKLQCGSGLSLHHSNLHCIIFYCIVRAGFVLCCM